MDKKARTVSAAKIKPKKEVALPKERTLTVIDYQLVSACSKGEIDSVYKCLWSNADVNAKVPTTGTTPIHEACQNGHFSVVKILLAFGSNPKITNNYGVTPLHWSAGSGETKMVKTMLEEGKCSGLDLGKKDEFGSTPLHFASVKNLEHIVFQLLDAGADPFLTNNDGRKPSDLTSSDTIRNYLIEEEARIIRNRTKATKKYASQEALNKLKERARKGLAPKPTAQKATILLPGSPSAKLISSQKKLNSFVSASK